MAVVLVEGGDQLPGLVGQYDMPDSPASPAPLFGVGHQFAVMASIFVSFVALWY